MRTTFSLIFTTLLSVANLFAQDEGGIRKVSSFLNRWEGAYDVAVSGDYAYVACGTGFGIIDVSDCEVPVEVGFCEARGYVYGIAVAGDYAYVANGGAGLQIVDVSNPTRPQEVALFDTPGYAEIVAVAGDYAYVTDCDGGLRVIEISNPEDPLEAGFLETYLPSYGIALNKNYVYAADWERGLRIIDVSDPTRPRQLGIYETESNSCGVSVIGDYAYVAYGNSGLRIVDVSDPAQPREVGCCDTLGWASDAIVDGNIAYVTNTWGMLYTLDVTDLTEPFVIGSYEMEEGAYDLTVAGSYALVATFYQGTLDPPEDEVLCIVDIDDPAHPQEVGSYCDPPGTILDVAASGNYAYVADYGAFYDDERNEAGTVIHVVDVSEPERPQETGFFSVSGLLHGIAVVREVAYVVAQENDRSLLSVVDVSNPAAPQIAGYCDLPEFTWGIDVAGDYAYFATRDSGLCIVDVSRPDAPHETGSCYIPNYAFEVSVAGNYAYVAAYHSGLRIIDVSNPESPREVGSYVSGANEDACHDVGIVGDYAYLANYRGFWVVNVSDPSQPYRVGSLAGDLYKIEVLGEYAYVLHNCLRVISIRNPAEPYEVGFYHTRGNTRDIAVSNEGLIYLARGLYLGIYDASEARGISSDYMPPPSSFILNEPYPNPFNAYTTITYTLPKQSDVTLQVYNIRGQLVDVLLDKVMPAGRHSVVWDGSKFSTGVYLVRMVDQDRNSTGIQKVVLVK